MQKSRLHLFFSLSILRIDRVGHLAWEPELFSRKQHKTVQKKITLFISENRRKACNGYLLSMLHRHLWIFSNDFAYDWIIRNRRRLEQSNLFTPIELVMNAENTNCFSEVCTPTIHFRKTENSTGQNFLKSIGMGEKDWFVCIFSRDQVYLNELYNNGKLPSSPSCHDFRDSDIESFRQAAELICSLGGWVFRMGTSPEKRLIAANNRIIDYAFEYRSEFLDIWLSANCRFMLGDPSGGTHINTIFNVPGGFTNWIPIGTKPMHKNSVYIPKKIRDKNTGKMIPYWELLEKYELESMLYTDFYLKNNYQWIDNSPEEIKALTQEMLDRTAGIFKYKPPELELMNKYFRLYKPKDRAFNVEIPVGLDFLQKNTDLFIRPDKNTDKRCPSG